MNLLIKNVTDIMILRGVLDTVFITVDDSSCYEVPQGKTQLRIGCGPGRGQHVLKSLFPGNDFSGVEVVLIPSETRG